MADQPSVIECAICFNSLNEEGEPPSSSLQPPSAKKVKTSGTQLDSPPCGHIFHSVCIIDWFNRGNATCPTCRKPITKRTLKQVYLPSIASPTPKENGKCTTCEDLKKKLEETEKEKLALQEEVEKLKKEKTELQETFNAQIDNMKVTQRSLQSVVASSRAEQRKLEETNSSLLLFKEKLLQEEKELGEDLSRENDCEKCKDRIDKLLQTIKSLQANRDAMKEKQEELEKEGVNLEQKLLDLLKEYRNLEGDVKQEKEKVEVIQKKMEELKESRQKLITDLDQMTVTNVQDKDRIKDLERSVASLETYLAGVLQQSEQ